MNNVKKILLSVLVLFSLVSFTIQKAQAMDPKAKAFLVLSTYGAAGGGLLGLASMAFGEESIAIARGASLGLYAGMIFSGYVLLSHKYRKKPGEEKLETNQYQDPYTPYTEEQSNEGYDSFFSSPQRAMQIEERRHRQLELFESPFDNRKGRPNGHPPVYFNLVNLNF